MDARLHRSVQLERRVLAECGAAIAAGVVQRQSSEPVTLLCSEAEVR